MLRRALMSGIFSERYASASRESSNSLGQRLNRYGLYRFPKLMITAANHLFSVSVTYLMVSNMVHPIDNINRAFELRSNEIVGIEVRVESRVAIDTVEVLASRTSDVARQ